MSAKSRRKKLAAYMDRQRRRAEADAANPREPSLLLCQHGQRMGECKDCEQLESLEVT